MKRKEKAANSFNPGKFKDSLLKAINGQRKSEFCRNADISYAYFNRYTNGKILVPPTLTTLYKISTASDSVSFLELAEAAGYSKNQITNSKYFYEDQNTKSISTQTMTSGFFLPVIYNFLEKETCDWRISGSTRSNNVPLEIEVLNERRRKLYYFLLPNTPDLEYKISQMIYEAHIELGSSVTFLTSSEEIFYSNLNISIDNEYFDISIALVKNGKISSSKNLSRHNRTV